MMEKGNWSGGHTAPNGENVYPYKVESGQPRDIHEAREMNVTEGEKDGR